MSTSGEGGTMMSVGDTMSTLGDTTMMSTLGDTMSTLGDIMSTLGVFSRVGDTMMSVGDILSTPGMFSTVAFPFKFSCFLNDLPLHLSYPMISSQCTEHPQSTYDISTILTISPMY